MWAGLFGHEHLTEHRSGVLADLAGPVANFHAALKAALERALAASTGVNLRFHHDAFRAAGKKLSGHRDGLLRRLAHVAFRHGDAALGQQLFGLKFVNVHALKKDLRD